MRAMMTAGEPFGIAPYGTEALGVMRIEKGHVAGNELNGQTTARDLGLDRMMSPRKISSAGDGGARPRCRSDRPPSSGSARSTHASDCAPAHFSLRPAGRHRGKR